MSYLEVLKKGDIPSKKKKVKTTPYDVFLEKKNLKTIDKSKQITIIKPNGFDEIQRLIDNLKIKQGIIIDFSDNNTADAQRMLDFLSGAVYALDGEIERVDKKMFIMTPKGVDIMNKL